MCDDKMMEEIVNEVLERLQLKSDKKNLFLIGPADLSFLVALEKRYHLITSEDRRNANVYSSEIQMEDIVDEVLITNLTIPILVDVALGTYHNLNEKIIVHALLTGKPVNVLEEGISYHEYKKSASKPLYQKYLEYEDKLKNYGVRFQSEKDFTLLSPTHKETYLGDMIGSSNEICDTDVVDFSGKHLILEKDIMALRNVYGATLRIEPRCIITPMAEDFIREHQMKVVRTMNG